MAGLNLEAWVILNCPKSEPEVIPFIPSKRKRKFNESRSDFWSRIAYNYVIRCDPSISGQDGHRTALRVATILIVGFYLTLDDALPIFQAWNHSCQPCWSKYDLVYKLEQALEIRDTHPDPGWLRTRLKRKSATKNKF